MLEWRGFPLGPGDATLGLPRDTALACLARQACPPARLQGLRGRRLDQAGGSLLPEAADPFFVAERIDSRISRHLAPAYSVLIVTDGTGALSTDAGLTVAIGRGSTVLIPFAAGLCTLAGEIQAVRCLPAV
jgi:mannose-6-phosphate isomerase